MESGWRGLFAVEQSPDAFKTLKYNLIDRRKDNQENPRFAWPDWLPKEPHEITAFLEYHRSKLEELHGKVHLVAGGPPCQGFSFAGKRTGDDPRNELFKHHLSVVDILKPELVLMENVQGIDIAFGIGKNGRKNKSERPKSFASRIRDILAEHGYEIQQHVLRACNFGVPQFRPRYFTLGIRLDLLDGQDSPCLKTFLYQIREEFLRHHGLPLDRPVTVAEAISDMMTTGRQLVDCMDEESATGFKEIVYGGPQTDYQRLMHGNKNGIAPNSLRLVNHRPETVARFQQILDTCRKGVQLSDDDRARLGIKKTAITPLSPDQPSHTLTTLPDDLLHYAEPRIHTVREHARLQSFPDWFAFRGKYTTGGDRRVQECPRYTQVGNAVPPLLAEAIGEVLHAIFRNLFEKLRNTAKDVSHDQSAGSKRFLGEPAYAPAGRQASNQCSS